MDTPEPQVLDGTEVYAPKELLPGGKTADAKPTAVAANKTEPVKAEQKPTEQASQTPEAKAPEPPKAQEGQEEVDPYEAAALASLEGESKPDVWTEDAKAALKARFGVDDPTEIETRISQAELIKQEYDSIVPLKQGLESMPPALKNAFNLAMQGKVEDALKYVKGIPDGVFMDKEAKHIPSEKLIPMYLEGKMTEEDFAILKDPDADPDEVKAVKAKEKHYRDIAADMHERKLAEVRNAQQESAKAQKEAYDNYVKSVAESLSHAKNTPLKAFVSKDVEQEIQTGNFVRRFLKEDGVTPTPEAASLLLKALHYDNMVKAQYNVGYKKGKSEAMLEIANGKPGAPPVAGRAAGGAPPKGELTPAQQILANLGRK